MKKNILFLSLVFFASLAFSQQYVQTINIEVPRGSRVESSEIIDGVATHNYSAKINIPINGIPFLNEHFQLGVLELHDGKKSDDVMMRYNIAKDLFEILRDDDTLTLNRPFAVKYVYLDEKVYMFNPKFREEAPRNQNGYFQQRVVGELSLFIKHRKDFSFHSFANNYQGGAGTKEYYYVDKTNYVGKTTDGKPFLITSSKSLLSKLDKHKSEIKSFIKKNKLKVKKETDLVKVVEYYNSL